jgi:CheY-like chemotaxis protein
MHSNSDIDEGNSAESARSPGSESELAHCREMLQRETLRHAEFLAHLNQALRTPLNAIMGFAELLEMKLGNDDNISQIRKAAHDLLDVIKHELAVPIETPSPTAVAGNSRCDILYIEDNPANFALVERILEDRPSLKVLQAARGETGLALAQSHNPKLILLDLNLPDAHGSDVLRRLQENPATTRIPVVVISADATPSQIERLLSAGARNYLTKPFDISPFLALVDEALGEPAGATS